MAETSPMMDQYFKMKSQYKHCLVFFRLGDFYELFFEDAVIASKELELTLTKRRYGNGQKADMCGVPHHSAGSYISRLIAKGFKVAVCEQLENQTDETKGGRSIVKREVIRVITPGTVTDSLALDETSNNYICCIFNGKACYGLAFADFTTGEFKATEITGAGSPKAVLDELEKYKPKEIICRNDFLTDGIAKLITERYEPLTPFVWDEWTFEYDTASKRLLNHFEAHTLDGFGFKEHKGALCAAGALLSYLYDTQKNVLSQITDISVYVISDYMMLDVAARRNLELTEPINGKNKKNCLYYVLNHTKTSMGARLLRRYIEQPLTNPAEINQRLKSVGEFKENLPLRLGLRDILNTMYDIERLTTRFVIKTANARDMVALKNSIARLPEMKKCLCDTKSSYFQVIGDELDPLTDIYKRIDEAIVEEPPVSVTEGGIIKGGFNYEVDDLLAAKTSGAKWLNDLAEREIKETGIKNLKIKNNRVFGYYIEVTKSNIHLAPARYIRRQTLGNCERYTTEELKKLEERITGAEERLFFLEHSIFLEIRDFITENTARILKTAQITALIDVCQSLAEAADKNCYCMPEFTEDNVIDIKGGRHPVVEAAMSEPFVTNDVYLDGEDDRLKIITGPNMAGKSTYMRQTALIVLMAQIGSFVPADYCRLKPVDKIFTRVGASDDLAAGQSTFMVEMAEVAGILRGATKDSLVILDEIGRGTSTFDGLSIAWAVLEYISDKKLIGAKTLFATHYHELTELEGKIPGVKNYCVLVKEHEDGIIFLRKIARGGAESSLGVAVAKLAGIPVKVLKRSRQILKKLNEADITKKTRTAAKEWTEEEEAVQPDLFSHKGDLLIEKIKSYDIMRMSPMEAMQALFDLQKDVKGL